MRTAAVSDRRGMRGMPGSRGGLRVFARAGWFGVVLAGLLALVLGEAGPVVAEPQQMPPRWTQLISEDGWVIDLSISNEVINHVENLAGASNSWEMIASMRVSAQITGTGTSPIQDAFVASGYRVGCRTDSSAGVEIGGDLGVDLSQEASIGGYFGGYGQGSQSGGGGGGFGGVQGNVGVGATEHLGGYLRVLLKPGGHTNVILDQINLREMSAVSNVRDQNIVADGCGGQVRVQSFASVKLRTDHGNDTQTLYGEIKDL